MADKVDAIQAAPAPKNIAELKSYLGVLSYYGKFLPYLSTVLAPLYRLLRVTNKWKWSKAEQQAFQASKKLLVSSKVLVHYDPEKELILACDASPHGVGAVLSHRMPDGSERPIGFASRTLLPAEKKYSQIEKEGLACVIGVKKIHTYLFGRHFTLLMDHKPLLGLLEEHRAVPSQASAWIQRWAMTLAMYEYSLGYCASASHCNADALSLLPLPFDSGTVPDPPEVVLLMEHLENSPMTATEIRKTTARDPVLARVLQNVQSGRPDECGAEELNKPYWLRRTELSTQQGCLLWGSRVVVPTSLRTSMLKELHDTHPGVSRMKSLGCMFVWWLGFD